MILFTKILPVTSLVIIHSRIKCIKSNVWFLKLFPIWLLPLFPVFFSFTHFHALCELAILFTFPWTPSQNSVPFSLTFPHTWNAVSPSLHCLAFLVFLKTDLKSLLLGEANPGLPEHHHFLLLSLWEHYFLLTSYIGSPKSLSAVLSFNTVNQH